MLGLLALKNEKSNLNCDSCVNCYKVEMYILFKVKLEIPEISREKTIYEMS